MSAVVYRHLYPLGILGALLTVLFVARAGAQRQSAVSATQPSRAFAIAVVDEQTGRGVPLVDLQTTAQVHYFTDSAGLIAIDDPALMGQQVYFGVSSHGYDFPADGFGFHGVKLQVKPGGAARIKVKRVNIAERLYRVNGAGIYRDSILLGRPAPIRHPLLDAQVAGQDSVQSVVYRGKIHWFWGDTTRLAYPLGHFATAGATSLLPRAGGLDPSVGVDLNYFADAGGFSRPMLPREKVPVWLDGLIVVHDAAGAERMIGMASSWKNLGQCTGRRIVVYNDQKDLFEPLHEVPLDAPLYPTGQAFSGRDGDVDYCYFSRSFPDVRVRSDWKSICDLHAYEAFTCLSPGARYETGKTRLDRDTDGKLIWAWKRDTGPLDDSQVRELVRAGKMKAQEAWFRPTDAATGQPITLRSGSVAYNAFRHRWVMIAVQQSGSSSALGEIWYAQADHPQGPWVSARKVVTHDHYSFYNPRHHDFFDQSGGKVIYFEGTYSAMFSRDHDLTPRYDCNQIMYRLDLSDPRLDLHRP